MVSSKKLNIVLDIGKTNVKLTFVDSFNNKTIKFFKTKQKNIYRIWYKNFKFEFYI